MEGRISNPDGPRIVAFIAAAAARLGWTTRVLDPEYGYLFEVSDGTRSKVLLGGHSPLNDAVSARIAQDKCYTALVLGRVGIRVPDAVRCLRPGYFRMASFADRAGPDPGLAFAKRRGYPLVVKPNRMSLGRDVTAVHDEGTLLRAIETAWEADYIALVQELVAGEDLRVDMLDGTLLAAYFRFAIRITGDGKQTIRNLVAARDKRFESDRMWTRLRNEPAWAEAVVARGWGEQTVLEWGEELDLGGPIQNLNRGATAEVIETVPPQWLRYVQRVGSALGLRHLGVDLKIPSAPSNTGLDSVDPQEATVIEVNASPSLVQLHELGHEERALEAQTRVLEALLQAPVASRS